MNKDREKFKNGFKNRIYQWVLEVLRFVDNLPKDSISRILGNQLIRSGTSVLANYVEAHSSNSKKDFAHYFRIALRSANESKIWLTLLKDMKRDKNKTIDTSLKELQEIVAILASSLITLKEKK